MLFSSIITQLTLYRNAKFGNADLTEAGESIRDNTVKILQNPPHKQNIQNFFDFPTLFGKKGGAFFKKNRYDGGE